MVVSSLQDQAQGHRTATMSRLSSSKFIKISNVSAHSVSRTAHFLFQPGCWTCWTSTSARSSFSWRRWEGAESRSGAHANKAGSIYTEPQPDRPRNRCHGDACDVIIGFLFQNSQKETRLEASRGEDTTGRGPAPRLSRLGASLFSLALLSRVFYSPRMFFHHRLCLNH